MVRRAAAAQDAGAIGVPKGAATRMPERRGATEARV
jgi:hypothetical protein